MQGFVQMNLLPSDLDRASLYQSDSVAISRKSATTSYLPDLLYLDLSQGSRIHDVVFIAHPGEFIGFGDDIRPLLVDKEEWKVECIDGDRATPQGITQCLIQWKGYRPDERPWTIWPMLRSLCDHL
jgi:hypothetical protein